MHLIRFFIVVFLYALIFFGCVQRQAAVCIDPAVSAEEQLPTVTVEALKDRITAGTATFILDVRTPEEYDGPLGHIEGARLIPAPELAQRLDELADVKNRPIFVICRSGGRSTNSCRPAVQIQLSCSRAA